DAEREQPGQAPGFSVRHSKRAKRLSIKVYPRGRVEVVVPNRTSARTVKSFVEENAAWIDRARDSFAEHYTPEAFVLPDIIRLPAVDQTAIVRYRPRPASKSVRFRFSNGILNLSGNTVSEKATVDALRRWLSGVARKEFEPRLRALSAVTGTPFEQMHIRMQRTCWGSRSCSGTISLNLCLLFVSPELLRYLMIHELCHGRHMNHSKRFWKMVSQHEPRYRSLDRRLGESWKAVPAWLGIY
ncbi:MAG: M48 family metallopeptidase, partial [Gammaproteobacteria bacterium]|nr:M48 family metallopeptidase [Gammaproteobacteria bacterium]